MSAQETFSAEPEGWSKGFVDMLPKLAAENNEQSKIEDVQDQSDKNQAQIQSSSASLMQVSKIPYSLFDSFITESLLRFCNSTLYPGNA